LKVMLLHGRGGLFTPAEVVKPRAGASNAVVWAQAAGCVARILE
jgi:hypothetical protein